MAAQIIDGRAGLAKGAAAAAPGRPHSWQQRGVVPGTGRGASWANDPGLARCTSATRPSACAELGIRSWQSTTLPADAAQDTRPELIELVRKLNSDDPEVARHPGPAPRCRNTIDEALVTSYIDPDKDVDAFHPFNVGTDHDRRLHLPALHAGRASWSSSQAHGIDLAGKDCVVVGRSNIVGQAPWPCCMLHAQCHGDHLPLPHPGSGFPHPPGAISWWRRWGGSASSPPTWSRRARWSSMWA